MTQRRALPILPHPKTRPEPAETSEKAALTGGSEKRHHFCLVIEVFLPVAWVTCFGLAGSIYQPFKRSPCSSGLCQVKPRCTRKLLGWFCTSQADTAERGQHCWRDGDKRNGREMASAILLALTEEPETKLSADGQWLTASMGLGFTAASGLCSYSRCASLYVWQSTGG